MPLLQQVLYSLCPSPLVGLRFFTYIVTFKLLILWRTLRTEIENVFKKGTFYSKGFILVNWFRTLQCPASWATERPTVHHLCSLSSKGSIQLRSIFRGRCGQCEGAGKGSGPKKNLQENGKKHGWGQGDLPPGLWRCTGQILRDEICFLFCIRMGRDKWRERT